MRMDQYVVTPPKADIPSMDDVLKMLDDAERDNVKSTPPPARGREEEPVSPLRPMVIQSNRGMGHVMEERRERRTPDAKASAPKANRPEMWDGFAISIDEDDVRPQDEDRGLLMTPKAGDRPARPKPDDSPGIRGDRPPTCAVPQEFNDSPARPKFEEGERPRSFSAAVASSQGPKTRSRGFSAVAAAAAAMGGGQEGSKTQQNRFNSISAVMQEARSSDPVEAAAAAALNIRQRVDSVKVFASSDDVDDLDDIASVPMAQRPTPRPPRRSEVLAVEASNLGLEVIEV